MSFYERGSVRIHYEEAGSGFPLLLIAGGALNSTLARLPGSPSIAWRRGGRGWTGVFQVDADRLRLQQNHGVWRG